MRIALRSALAGLIVTGLAASAAADPRISSVPFETQAPQATMPPQSSAPAKTKSVADDFWAALSAPGGVSKARQIYDETRKTDKKTVIFSEEDLNQFGYELLQGGRAKDAIVVFKMNNEEYPNSANTYDSLSDGYLADGNNDEALRLAEKTLEMLAKDTQAPDEFKQQVRESAEAKIKQLKKK